MCAELALEPLPEPQLCGGLRSDDIQRCVCAWQSVELGGAPTPDVPGIKGSVHELLSSSSCCMPLEDKTLELAGCAESETRKLDADKYV